MPKIPVSIISPVRNCLSSCEKHAAYLNHMADVVEEVLIVDSYSEDGTEAELKRLLTKPNIFFHQHPPGLYPSWNHGVKMSSQPYCTFATVGDELPADSLRQLLEAAQQLQADITLSAPTLLENGSVADRKWPIHEVIELFGETKPFRLENDLVGLILLSHSPFALIGSSASNLYKTDSMKENPFPSEYGHAGDYAWAIMVSDKLKWAIAPQVKSTFLIEPPSPNAQKPKEEILKRHEILVGKLALHLSQSPTFSKVSPSYFKQLQAVAQIPLQISAFKLKCPNGKMLYIHPWYVINRLRLSKLRRSVQSQALALLTKHHQSIDS